MALIQCILAIGVMQVANTLPSPYREILLFCICIGVLWGGLLVEQASKKISDGPPAPEGWSWMEEKESPSSKNKRKRKAKDDEEEDEEMARARVKPEVLMLPGKGQKSLGVALVPGNPGIPHYYCEFGEELQKAFENEDSVNSPTIYCVGYVNFATRAENQERRQKAGGPLSVVEEAAKVAEVLEELQESHPDGFVILGHSIGAWVVLQHLKTRTAEQVGQIPLAVLAMPYLEYRPFSSQRLLALPPLFLTRLISLTAAALPSKLKDLLALLLSKNPQGSIAHDATVKSFLSQPHQFTAVLEFYRTEWVRLNAAQQGQGFSECESILKSKRPRILAMYTKGDMWAPMEHSIQLRGLLSKQDEVIDLCLDPALKGLEPPSHAFVLSREHSKQIAGIVAASFAKKR